MKRVYTRFQRTSGPHETAPRPVLAVYSVRSQFLGLQARECQGWVTGRPAERQGALTAFVAALGALAVVQLIDRLWARPRPFVAHPDTVHLLVAHAADASFPSDHVVAACAIAVVLVSFHRRLGAIALLLAAVLAYDRVYIGVHYPGDVLGGMFLGTLVALLLVMQLAPPMDRLRTLVDRIIQLMRLLLPA